MKKKYIIILLIAFIGAVMLNYINCSNFSFNEKEIITKIDTIYHIDTIRVIQPIHDTVYLNKYITDTLTLAGDTVKVLVNVPISSKIYSNEQYRAVISGFKPSLDTLEVFPRTCTIYKEKVVKSPKKRFNYGIQAGLGYGIINKKPDLYIGVGINYNF